MASRIDIPTSEVGSQINVPKEDLPHGVLTFDLECTGLDPRIESITEIALSDAVNTTVFSVERPGDPVDEAALIQVFGVHLSSYLQANPDTLLASWNGSGFDAPYLMTRIDALGLLGHIIPGWDGTLIPRPGLPRKYAPAGSYTVPQTLLWSQKWRDHDIAPLFKKHAHAHGVAHGLKPVSRTYGYDPIELDRAHMEKYSRQERAAYGASDTVLTLALAGKIVTAR